jgi:hypothetical protein
MLGLTVVTFVLVYFLIQPWLRRRQLSQRVNEENLPNTLTAHARSLIPPQEVALFNLLHLVSRDIFLAFAKVPFRSLVQVNTDDEDARRECVKTMRSLTADFVLVHPGTMLPSKIIMVGGKDNDSIQSNSPNTLMKVLCQEAEIDLIWLEAAKNYSAMELTEILGLKEED